MVLIMPIDEPPRVLVGDMSIVPKGGCRMAMVVMGLAWTSAGWFPCRPPERRMQQLVMIVTVGKHTNPHSDVVRLCSIGGVSNAMHMQAGSWRFEVHPSQARRIRLRPGDEVNDKERESEVETEHQGARP